MFCSECGKQVADDAKFCGECGTVQTTAGLETSTTASNRIQSCPSCNIKGWEHGKQCGSCGYVEGEEVTTRNKLQASVTSPSSGNSNVAGYVVGAIFVFAAGYFTVGHFAEDKAETTEIAQSNQVESVPMQAVEEKVNLAQATEATRTASAEREHKAQVDIAQNPKSISLLKEYSEDDLAICGVVTAKVYGLAIHDMTSRTLDDNLEKQTKELASVMDWNLQVLKFARDNKRDVNNIQIESLEKSYSAQFKYIAIAELLNHSQQCIEKFRPLFNAMISEKRLREVHY